MTKRTSNTGSATLAAGGLTLLGMCLPWAHVGRLSVSGWSGSANFVGVPFPGCLVAMVAAGAIACLRPHAAVTRKRSWFTPLLLCGYGVFHSAFMALALTATSGISAGVGIPITMFSFAMIVFCTFIRCGSCVDDVPAG